MISVSEATATVARTAFPQGSPAMTLRDQLGPVYQDVDFQALLSAAQRQPAWSAGRLALITVMQYLEDLSDRQAAQAVRGRINWKYATCQSCSQLAPCTRSQKQDRRLTLRP